MSVLLPASKMCEPSCDTASLFQACESEVVGAEVARAVVRQVDRRVVAGGSRETAVARQGGDLPRLRAVESRRPVRVLEADVDALAVVRRHRPAAGADPRNRDGVAHCGRERQHDRHVGVAVGQVGGVRRGLEAAVLRALVTSTTLPGDPGAPLQTKVVLVTSDSSRTLSAFVSGPPVIRVPPPCSASRWVGDAGQQAVGADSAGGARRPVCPVRSVRSVGAGGACRTGRAVRPFEPAAPVAPLAPVAPFAPAAMVAPFVPAAPFARSRLRHRLHRLAPPHLGHRCKDSPST